MHKANELTWEYYDLVIGGWIEEEDVKCNESNACFLILTEGKTDTEIISKSIQHLIPDISDLFYFADMDNHPFGGTKDIVKFCKGLKDINYKDNVIVLLDNDLAGNKALDKLKDFNLPVNIKALTLPCHDDFNNFLTKGTNGDSHMNINGNAVSIESFLDLQIDQTTPYIRWIEWDKDKSSYHGRFDEKYKNQLQNKFHNAIKNNTQEYNFSRLEFLLDFIVSEAIKMT